jgi:hypothetical protein
VVCVPDSIKETEEKRTVFEKKQVPMHQSAKAVQPEQSIVVARERETVQINYRKALNDLQNFSQKLEETEQENLREIKRLRREKENVEAELGWHLKCKDDRRLLVELMVDQTEPFFSEDGGDYD